MHVSSNTTDDKNVTLIETFMQKKNFSDLVACHGIVLFPPKHNLFNYVIMPVLYDFTDKIIE